MGSPNLDQARRHVTLLTGAPNTPVALTAIRPKKSPEDTHNTATRFGDLHANWPWVIAQQGQGASIYVTVNKTAGAKREKGDIQEVRSVWVDDDVPRDGHRTDWPLEPSFIVETSPGKFHYYWRTSTEPGPQFDGVMQHMVSVHGGDNGAKDSARVLRLAGTCNTKKDAGLFQARIVATNGRPPYTWSGILAAFPPQRDADGKVKKPPLDVDEAITTLRTGAPGMHGALIRLAGRLVAKGMGRFESEEILRALILSGDGAGRTDRLEQIPDAVASAIRKFSPEFGDVDVGDEVDPMDLFASHPPPAEFAPGDYPPLIARLAVDMAERMGCDPKIPAWTALVACAATVPDTLRVRPKAHDHTWSERPCLWVALVGAPSSKKSPPMSATLAPVNDVQKDLWARYQRRVKEWEAKVAEAKREKLPEPSKPTPERIMVGDVTTEALTSICSDNSAGVLVAHDELTGFFGSIDAYRQNGASKDRPIWLQAFNGGGYTVDRVERHGAHEVRRGRKA